MNMSGTSSVTLVLPCDPVESPWSLDALGPPAFSMVAHGVPGPQGSKKAVGVVKRGPRAGQAILVESSKKVKPWREAVVDAANLVLRFKHRGWVPLDGPLVADMVFSMPRPARFPTGDARRVHGCHTTYPDLSKLTRSTEDALTTAGVWADDARVVGYRRNDKVYTKAYDPDAMLVPGVVIRVWRAPVGLVGT